MADYTTFVRDYRTGDKHEGRAAVIRGKAVNRALMTDGVTLQDLADALTADGIGKVSKATLSNYGRAYRVVGDAALPLTVDDAAAPVLSVLRAINRGASSALNDWEKTARSTQTWTPDTFTAAMDALQKSATSRTGMRKGQQTVTAEGAEPRKPQTPPSDKPEPTVKIDALAETITAVDLAELMARVAANRTFSEDETNTLFAGMAALTDSLEHADDTAAALAAA